MEPRTLDGMAAFIHRVRARLDEAAAHQPPEVPAVPPPDPDAAAEAGPLPEEPALEQPLYAQQEQEAAASEAAGDEPDWQLAEQALASGAAQQATVVGWNRGGLLVHWHLLQGFLPASQLQRMIRYSTDAERDAAFASRVGEELQLRVIEVDRSRKRLVFSERALQWGAGSGQCLWEELAPGQVRRGRVRNLCEFGAFVDLGGIDGLIHVSELAWRHVRHPSEALQIGQEVDVYVMAVEPGRKRVALSLKKLSRDPWHDIEARYRAGQTVQGTITNVLSFGAFVHIEDGVEGLIHISELAEGSFLHPRNVVAEGDAVTVRIVSIDSANRRLALSLRQAHQAAGNGRVEGPAHPSE